MTEAGPGVEPVSEAPPLNRMVVAVLSLMGIFLAFYLLAHNLGWTGPIQCGVGDCGTVQSSRFAYVGPVPVSGIGLAGYTVLFTLAVAGLHPARRRSPVIAFLLVGGATIGVAFSAWLTYLEAAVINAWCMYCVMSAILITLIFLATLPEVRRAVATG